MFLPSHTQRVNLARILFIPNKVNWNVKSLPGHRMGEAIVCPKMSVGFHMVDFQEVKLLYGLNILAMLEGMFLLPQPIAFSLATTFFLGCMIWDTENSDIMTYPFFIKIMLYWIPPKLKKKNRFYMTLILTISSCW